MVDGRGLRRARERRAQRSLRFVLARDRAVQVGEVERRLHERRVELERLAVRRRGLGVAAARREQVAERGLRLRPVGVETLRGDVLLERRLEPLAVVGREARLRLARERARRVHAHQAHRVPEHAREELRPRRRVGAGERAHRGRAHHRIGIVQGVANRLECGWTQIAGKPLQRARTDDRALRAVLGDAD